MYFKEILSILAFILFAVLPFTEANSQTTATTRVEGTVTDIRTGMPLEGAFAGFADSGNGVFTGSDGKYRLETTSHSDRIIFRFTGYDTISVKVIYGRSQVVNTAMSFSSIDIGEVEIKPPRRKYSNRNNPAVDLIAKVTDNSNHNRKEKYDFLEYRKYEKISFALTGLREASVKRVMGKMSFAFDTTFSAGIEGKTGLLLYLREKISGHYFRKDPHAEKEITRAVNDYNPGRFTDTRGISEKINYFYQDINVYDNEILFLNNRFISPAAASGPLFYKYFITDTVFIENTECIRLRFEPRNKADHLFEGYLWIIPASRYAVRKIEMSLNARINLDWISDIKITQDFIETEDNDWLPSREEISVGFGVKADLAGLKGTRVRTFDSYVINRSHDGDIFRGFSEAENLVERHQTPAYVDSIRPVALGRSENELRSTLDSINNIPSYSRWMKFIMMFPNDLIDLGKIALGPEDNFFSFNPAEGNRLYFGGRTTEDFSKRITVDSYVAYGFADRDLKYNLGLIFSLSPKTIYEFPVKSILVSYRKDLLIPGQDYRFSDNNNFFSSFKRGIDDKFVMNKTLRIEYLNEWESHLSVMTGFSYTDQSARGKLRFSYEDYLSGPEISDGITISELYGTLRYAPNESFYQKALYRNRYRNRYPVFELNYALGNKSIGNDYNYLRLQFTVQKRFYTPVIGVSDISVTTGKIFGTVSYPLLFMHRANQTYGYQAGAYNMMNFLEFVSDSYLAINADHNFNGLLFNKIPLVNRLKLREVLSFKILLGKLDLSNDPAVNEGLLRFPVDDTGTALTQSLHEGPYIEASAGIANILHLFRIDLVKRFTYLDNPYISHTGIRFMFEFAL